MREYEYVNKAEYMPVKKELEQVLRIAQGIMTEKYGVDFYFQLIGSGKNHLITRIKGGNKGFDFDYNLIIKEEDAYSVRSEIMKKHFMDALDAACKGTSYKPAEDSSSVITIKRVDQKNSKILFGADFAIVYYEGNDRYNTMFSIVKKNNGGYGFEPRDYTTGTEMKLNTVYEHNPKRAWNWIRKEYLKVKNHNQDSNKTSFQLRCEAINNVFNQIWQAEANTPASKISISKILQEKGYITYTEILQAEGYLKNPCASAEMMYNNSRKSCQ